MFYGLLTLVLSTNESLLELGIVDLPVIAFLEGPSRVTIFAPGAKVFLSNFYAFLCNLPLLEFGI